MCAYLKPPKESEEQVGMIEKAGQGTRETMRRLAILEGVQTFRSSLPLPQASCVSFMQPSLCSMSINLGVSGVLIFNCTVWNKALYAFFLQIFKNYPRGVCALWWYHEEEESKDAITTSKLWSMLSLGQAKNSSAVHPVPQNEEDHGYTIHMQENCMTCIKMVSVPLLNDHAVDGIFHTSWVFLVHSYWW